MYFVTPWHSGVQEPFLPQPWKWRRGCGQKDLLLYHQSFLWALGFCNIKTNILETEKMFSAFL